MKADSDSSTVGPLTSPLTGPVAEAEDSIPWGRQHAICSRVCFWPFSPYFVGVPAISGGNALFISSSGVSHGQERKETKR